MSNFKFGLLLTGLLGSIACTAAQAIPVQIDYSFVVDDASVFGGFPSGLGVNGRAVYDTEAVLTRSGGYSLLSHTVEINGTTYESAPGVFGFGSNVYFLDQVPSTPPRDTFAVSSTFDINLGGDLNIGYVGFSLDGLDTLFAGREPFVPNPSLFIVSTGFVSFTNGSACPSCSVGGSLQRISFSPSATEVPEPASVALFVTGLAGIFFARRKRAH